MEGLRNNSMLSVFLLILLRVFSPVYSQRSDCRTPRGAAGQCVILNRCAPLLQSLQQRQDDAYVYVQQSQCGFEGIDPMVCCPIGTGGGVTQATVSPTQRGSWDLSSNPNLPRLCGEDLTQRIVGGDKADIFEFPWMALLEYTKPNGRTTACGGVLISKRYVLTAAHCVKGKDLPKTWNLVSVRLGEYDTSTEKDCISEGDATEFCIDDPVTVGVEEQIVHEEYKPQSRDQANDIALLRLTRNVPFTSYIRPICLPRDTSITAKMFHVAGWGKTETKSESDVKLKVTIPLANDVQCSNVYRAAAINLADSQICAGGERGRDSCRGDSGGPLMTVQTSNEGTMQWTVAGVVSFGPSPCGMQNWPGVYTKVSSFVPWILSKIRP